MKFKRVILWFRQDLRLHDNEALLEAIKNSDEVIPIYVFDERVFQSKTTFGFPKTGKFSFAINTTQRDYVVLKAIKKPLINLLWIGTIILIIGFVMAIIRRYREFRLMRDKFAENGTR